MRFGKGEYRDGVAERCGGLMRNTRTDASHREHDDDWILQPIQKGGSVKTFYKHVARGQVARLDRTATY